METKDPNNNNEEISLESVQCLPLELEDLYKLIFKSINETATTFNACQNLFLQRLKCNYPIDPRETYLHVATGMTSNSPGAIALVK